MTMQKLKTILIVACPGSGKTTWAKFMNSGLFPEERVVTDYDYSGFRPQNEDAEGIRIAQSCLFNALAKAGAPVILTHYYSFDPAYIDTSLISVWFIVPNDVETMRWYAINVLKRNRVTPWAKEYAKLATKKYVKQLDDYAWLCAETLGCGSRVIYSPKVYLGALIETDLCAYYLQAMRKEEDSCNERQG